MKAFLFDFDGVVVDSEPVHFKTFMEFVHPLGVKVDEERWYREFAGTGSKNIFTVLLGEAGITDEKTIDGYVEKRKKIYCELIKKGAVKAKPGISEVLELAEKRGIRKVVVSGGHRENIITALSVLGLEDRFEFVLGSGDYDRRKPYPDAFLKAAEKLGVEPSSCMVFEDSISGFTAAKDAGMKIILLESPAVKNINKDEVLAVIKDFRGFPEELLSD